MNYRGRFAPSPTGPLHAGSLVAALASWLDARAHGGVWLVRMEDVDAARCSAFAAQTILWQLAQLGLHSDEPVVWQSTRTVVYQTALDALLADRRAYACTCSRSAIALANAAQGWAKPRFGELVYPGTCRNKLANAGDALQTHKKQAFRLFVQHPRHLFAMYSVANVGLESAQEYGAVKAAELAQPAKTTRAALDVQLRASGNWHWHDRLLGPQTQDIENEVGDFVLKRADGHWAYQLAVVVDDAAQGITHVVRGQDLADNTARQMLLQTALGLPEPVYMHTPLVLGHDGTKLSKQNGAAPLDLSHPRAVCAALNDAAQVLGLLAKPALEADMQTPARRASGEAGSLGDTLPDPADQLRSWIAPWQARFCKPSALDPAGQAALALRQSKNDCSIAP